MNESSLIRLDNLKRLGLNAAELHQHVGGGTSYWHGMLSGDRPFGEKIARKIEDKLQLAKGSMDESEAVKPVSVAAYKPSPFALALASRYDSLPDDDEIRSFAFVTAMEAMRKAIDQKSTPASDGPMPALPVKQWHEPHQP